MKRELWIHKTGKFIGRVERGQAPARVREMAIFANTLPKHPSIVGWLGGCFWFRFFLRRKRNDTTYLQGHEESTIEEETAGSPGRAGERHR